MDNQNTTFTTPPPSGTGGNRSGSASSNSIIALVLGILSWFVCPVILGIAAWIVANKEIREIDEGRSPQAGRTMAVVGKWLGIANVILVTLGVIVYIVIVVFIIGVASLSN